MSTADMSPFDTLCVALLVFGVLVQTMHAVGRWMMKR
ncbi:hypothetical protein SEA_TYKE_11 [Mycobacterium phage Tyke]|uniref:Uncharacterized protein n=1 Tax=Mycobacterium phage DTDevon TaxID=1701800 RepID=A0A0N9EPG8_9CAUD|nr:hypothetical protein SEA_DTDEVON_11 [Mycobacterium phage DTDevon]AVR77749.1 hypothetical protein SEA_TYKE_11 [Mycobacterium phage Tyke]